MAFEYKRIDVDSHCQEKPDTWTSRMSRKNGGTASLRSGKRTGASSGFATAG